MKHSFAHGLRSGLCLMLALLLVLSAPATALAAAKDDYCAEGYAAAETAVETAMSYVADGNKAVDIIVDLLGNTVVKLLFKGFSTDASYIDTALGMIEDELANHKDIVTNLGFSLEKDSEKVSKELFICACIYYHTINGGFNDKFGFEGEAKKTYNIASGDANAARKATILELIRFVLVETKKFSNSDAEATAAEYYEYYTLGEAKALEKALTKYATKHTFADGKCSSCGTKDPNYVPPTTEPPATTEPVATEPPATTEPVATEPHVHKYTTDVIAPTCTEKGYTLHTCECGNSYTSNEVAATGHSYGKVSWTWLDDGSKPYISKRCASCDDQVKVEATVTSKVTTAATCTTSGTTEHSAVATTDGKEYSFNKTETTAALGHNLEMKWTWEGTTAATVSYTCKNDNTHTGTATATITSATTEPTCTADGQTVYTATVTIDGVAYTDTKTETIASTGHTYDVENASWSWSGTRSATVTVKCSTCNSSTRGRATITNAVTTEPTCSAEGVRTYTATATVNDVELTDTKTEAIAKVDHTFADGKCSVCGEADPDYVAPPTTEPPVTEPTHTHSYTAKVTKPTCTEKGYTTYTCSCGDSYTADEVAATGHTFGEWVIVKDASSKEAGKEERACACGEKETREIPKLTGSFTDVKATDYYYEPVLWAVNKGITAGTSATTFGPAAPCTRAQVVTFLWRAAGSPEPKATSTTFTDVKAGDYYYKAVLWAVEEGITSGMSATSFGSSSICTRAQVVTFLWRAAGSPEAKNTTSTFTDVKSSDYYCKAVLWAVENGITAGMSATSFGSANNCSRGQIVTFLYKAYVK